MSINSARAAVILYAHPLARQRLSHYRDGRIVTRETNDLTQEAQSADDRCKI